MPFDIQFASIDEVADRSMGVLAPPDELTVSQWSDKNRRLSEESSASPGRWKTEVVEFMREPMDCVGDPRVSRVAVMAAAQVSKTETLLNVIGYCIDHDPSPIMLVQPTLDMAEAFSKDRLSPMLRDTPCLKGKVRDARSRNSDNTVKQKKFPGGHVTMVGANSPSSLASRPIRVVLCDEVDRFPDSAGAEGDPIQLAVKRSTTFWNRILMFVSTPTNKHASRIEDEYQQGDQRQWWVPCADCGEHQVLRWSSVYWDSGKPDTAHYVCEHCGSVWNDNKRMIAVRKGHWRAQAEFNGNATFHVTGLMSPFVRMSEAAREFLAAKGNPEKLKVWVNTYLGETWEDAGERLDHTDLMERCEEYETPVPAGVTLLTAGVDVQDDRLEYEVVGWGDDYESWSIKYEVIYGDPSTSAPWQELTSVLKQPFAHPMFGQIGLRATCIDSGGHFTAKVYKYTKTMPRLFAIKGVGGQGRPMVSRPSRNNIEKIQLFAIGSDALKEIVFARLRSKPGKGGYCHFPAGRSEEYFRQLTAEKLMTRVVKGFKKREYFKVRPRNEALDMRCYATAALEMLGVDLRAQRLALMRTVMTAKPSKQEGKKQQSGRRSASWVDKWKHDN